MPWHCRCVWSKRCKVFPIWSVYAVCARREHRGHSRLPARLPAISTDGTRPIKARSFLQYRCWAPAGAKDGTDVAFVIWTSANIHCRKKLQTSRSKRSGRSNSQTTKDSKRQSEKHQDILCDHFQHCLGKQPRESAVQCAICRRSGKAFACPASVCRSSGSQHAWLSGSMLDGFHPTLFLWTLKLWHFWGDRVPGDSRLASPSAVLQ